MKNTSKTIQYVTRKHKFDSQHRVLNHVSACSNFHGHTYHVSLTFGFSESKDIGYPIDFKEIKRIGCNWIDDYLDHGAVHNPNDTAIIDLVKSENKKLWLMSLNGKDKFCNPSAENIAKELFLAMKILFNKYSNIWIEEVVLYETPNCFTTCTEDSISYIETVNFNTARYEQIKAYAEEKGTLEYDDRKVTAEDLKIVDVEN